ncbi:MAG TPA: ribonuclease R [Gammaproteobacteria bacterium]|nr:ribonuclease R [Gammaproteobacteria bacterium]
MTQKDEFNRREKTRYVDPILSREDLLGLFQKKNQRLSWKSILDLADFSKKSMNDALMKRLQAMVRDGQLECNDQGYALAGNLDLIKGIVHRSKNKEAQLISDDPVYDRLHLKSYDLINIMVGDELLVRVLPMKIGGIHTCSVVDIIKRGTKSFIGTIYRKGGYVYVHSQCKSINQSVLIKGGFDLEDGELVRVEIIKYPSRRNHFSARVVERLGQAFDDYSEVRMAIDKHGLRCKWPTEVLSELAKIGTFVDEECIKGRVDWREFHLITIDGADAKDYDDAVYVEELSEGGWCVRVAIADVGHYVQSGTALDKEAQLRATSVYFPGYVIPMLPEKLSNGLCSLKAHQDRLALGVEVVLDHQGEVMHFDVKEVVVNISARMTYQVVSDYLEGTQQAPSWFVEPLSGLRSCFDALLKVRNDRGAMDFNISESQLIFDQKGLISGFKPLKRLTSHRMIEELMLLSNQCIATWVKTKKQATLYRVHAIPDEDRLEPVMAYFKRLGVKFPRHIKTTKDYFKALTDLRHASDTSVGEIMMLRAMPQAYYAPDEKTGHFGLGYQDYLHFTSPIRRYPDLVVHRLIKSLVNHQGCGDVNLGWLGAHCSFREREAEEASRDVLAWLKCRWLKSHIGSTFDAVITTVINYGLFVSLDNIFIDGMVHVSTLGKGYFQYDAYKSTLSSKVGDKSFSVGQRVVVKIIKVDVMNQYIDCTII